MKTLLSLFFLFIPLLMVASVSRGDQYEKVLECYREQHQNAMQFNRVLDLVKDEASANEFAPKLEEINARNEAINRKIEQMPDETEPPENHELRFASTMYDETGLLAAYLLDQNLRRIKALGIRSEAFNKAVKGMISNWPQWDVEPFDLMKHLAISARYRERLRTGATLTSKMD